MNKEQTVEIIETIQKTVEQMKIDDINESPDSAYEMFNCDCCGEEKTLAGSLIYDTYLLCNDCVLLAEISFKLNKINSIDELMNSMEDKRFENLYAAIFDENGNVNN